MSMNKEQFAEMITRYRDHFLEIQQVQSDITDKIKELRDDLECLGASVESADADLAVRMAQNVSSLKKDIVMLDETVRAFNRRTATIWGRLAWVFRGR